MKLVVTRFDRRQVIGLSLLATLCLFLLSQFTLVQSASPQQAKRTFENKIPGHVPLKVKIKKDKEEKALDPENKNWFRDIEIEITNTSDKPIYFLSMDVIMPELLTDAGVMTTFPLMYGRVEFYDHNTKPSTEDIPIEPKATHVFKFEDHYKAGYEAWRKKNNKTDPMKLEAWISHLSYGDGTGFTSMSAIPFPFKQDPDEIGSCVEKARPPDQWSKTPTIFSALYAENFRRPAALLPVNFFAADSRPSELALWGTGFARYLLSRDVL